jgi:Arc/MetJ-type ribon-helix-helix transcriptional regulator
MTYQLPPDIDQRVQSQIALGIYQTPDQVLNEALDALDARRKLAETASADLASRGINESQAADLRQRLKSFADDWNRPEMDVYDAV